MLVNKNQLVQVLNMFLNCVSLGHQLALTCVDHHWLKTTLNELRFERKSIQISHRSISQHKLAPHINASPRPYKTSVERKFNMSELALICVRRLASAFGPHLRLELCGAADFYAKQTIPKVCYSLQTTVPAVAQDRTKPKLFATLIAHTCVVTWPCSSQNKE